MPFKFKLGRKKSGSPAPDAATNASPVGTSTFRVIPRGGASDRKGAKVIEKPLPSLGHHGRTWSEEDTSSSNRASDSTSSTNQSRAYENRSYDRSSTSYGEKSTDSDHRNAYFHSTDSAVGSDRRVYLDMPSSFGDQQEFGDIFGASDNKSKPAQSPNRKFFETPARYSKQSKTPPLHNSRSSDLRPLPLSPQSFSSDEDSLSPSLAEPSTDRPPPPPLHKSPPVKIQTFDGVRNAVSPSFSDDFRTDSWEPPVIKRMESTESFTRSGANIDADANMVRNSVLIRRNTAELSELANSSPLRPAVAPRRSSLHPPPHLSPFTSSTTSSKSPSVSSTASSQGQTLSEMSTTPKPTTPTIGQTLSPSNNTTPRAAPAREVSHDSDSEDEPLAHTLQRISSNPRLSIVPPISRGSRMSILPPETLRSSKLDDRRPASTASGESEGSQGKTRSSGEQNLTVPNQTYGLTSTTTQSLGTGINQSSRLSVAGLSTSPSNLSTQISPNLESSKLSDDDDDVPLALLPTTNSPVRGRLNDARISQYSFMGQSRPASTFGAPSMTGARNSLPPFARRLPHDPYGNAESVLNASRDSLLLNRPAHAFPPGQSPVPGLPPGGLVGVIAEEERSKSWRRAAGAGQVGPTSLNPGMSMGMQGPMSIPGFGPGLMGAQQMGPGMGAEQTQFNQQLVQLVHQQSMMLQQMQAMMQQQQYAGSVMGFSEPDFAQQAPGSPGLRPRSMLNPELRTRSMINLNRPSNAPRTMSMISTGAPYASNWNMASEPLISSATSVRGLANGYASSVAPSERSTVGQSNRYRPVTNLQAAADTQSNYGGYNRSSMAKAPVYGPLAGSETNEEIIAKKKKSGFFSAMIHPRGRNHDMHVEEEEDWGSFAQKRRSTMPTNALA